MDSLTLLYDCKTKVLQRFFIAKNNKRKHRFLHVPHKNEQIKPMVEKVYINGQPVQTEQLPHIRSPSSGFIADHVIIGHSGLNTRDESKSKGLKI